MLTLYVTTGHSGYVLHVENLIESLTVTGGTEAVVLSLEHSPGIEELLSAWAGVAAKTSCTRPATATTPRAGQGRRPALDRRPQRRHRDPQPPGTNPARPPQQYC